MAENQNNVAPAQANVMQPIIRPTETVEFLTSAIGQELKKMEMTQQLARTYSMSSIVPTRFQGQANLGNCYIAAEMAQRLGASPLMVMQNLYVVHGNPGWSAKFLIATFNCCGKYTPIQYQYKGKVGTDEYGIRAFSYDINDKDRKNPLYGTWIDIKLAKAEGWYTTNPKWKNMTEQMLRYRAAAWFINTQAPEISMGIKTVEEIEDIKRVEDADFIEETDNQIREATFEENIPENEELKGESSNNPHTLFE